MQKITIGQLKVGKLAFSMIEKGNLIKDKEYIELLCENLITATGNHAQKTAKI